MAEHMQTTTLRGWVGADGSEAPDDREDRLLPWRSVRDIAGISRTTAWRMQQTGDFPHPVPISANRVGWWESELTAWKAKRRLASQPRPRPYAAAPAMREARLSAGGRDSARPPAVEPCPPAQEPAPRPTAPRRRGRPRLVSPDQIDFGF